MTSFSLIILVTYLQMHKYVNATSRIHLVLPMCMDVIAEVFLVCQLTRITGKVPLW